MASHETELYYLQSRYYDPQLGRFINADSLVTTGNGMASSNMFAYCLNNPVNGCDPCGTCFHRWDFWKDCERCAGKTLDEKLNILAADIYDYATDVYAAHMMQNEWQRQVDQNSFGVAVAVGEAIVESIEIQNEAQRQQDQVVHSYIVDNFSSPQKIAESLRSAGTTLSLVSAYAGGVAGGLNIPTLGMSTAVAGKVVAVTAILAAVVNQLADIID